MEKERKIFSLEKELETLLKKNIEYILCDGFYSSSWFGVRIEKKDKELYFQMNPEKKDDYAREDIWEWIILNGGEIIVEDIEEEKEHKLNYKKLKEGWFKVIVNHPNVFANIINENADFYDYDCVLQYTIFGEWVYG